MKITMLLGSNRNQATSTTLMKYMKTILEDRGHTVHIFDLYKEPLPFYNPDYDMEEDANVIKLKKLVAEADGIILSTPEYHGSISGVLKNALDYLEQYHFAGKAVLPVSSAGGPIGVHSLTHLQTIIRSLHGVNCTEWISMGGNQREFNAQNEPQNGAFKQRVGHAISHFEKLANALQQVSS
ncbi:NADPH-dependent FMN reductase [Longirhabdus pacifica]|uniref:NADPH-dependent FMN reductase n=1 Tax=Longirhabdus pacifica TaxID=2305227 RepID=UPI001008BB67|nr:NADPH-dependent FMN reductase [Longirhabdus pacifica]